jgi:hypothetical protein
MVINIENEFIGKGEVSGFTFTKEYESDGGYVYKVNTGSGFHYEAFKKKEVAVCLDFENRVYSDTETKEVYPKSNDFGVWAWSLGSLELAVETLSKHT